MAHPLSPLVYTNPVSKRPATPIPSSSCRSPPLFFPPGGAGASVLATVTYMNEAGFYSGACEFPVHLKRTNRYTVPHEGVVPMRKAHVLAAVTALTLLLGLPQTAKCG
jgi:hypothetical protein